MRSLARRTPWAVVVAAFSVAAACAESSDLGGNPPPGPTFGSDASSPTADGDTPSCKTRCSADLHQILDCSTPPNVLRECTGTTGCGPGTADNPDLTCIDACASAAANKSSIGCDFYTIPPDAYMTSDSFPGGSLSKAGGSCFAAFVNNTWDEPLQVSLEWKGQRIDATPFAYLPTGAGTSLTYSPIPSTGIPANQMAIVFVNQYAADSTPNASRIACPASVHAAIETEDVGLHGTGIGNAVHLMTTLPAAIYDIYPYGGAPSYLASATLLLPTTVWDKNYVAVSAYDTANLAPSEVEIVGMVDNTQVTLLPTAAIAAGGMDAGVEGGAEGGVNGAPAGAPVTYTLQKGQLLQFTQLADLSGTPIQATQPVGLWGSHWCAQIPWGYDACDAAHQQIPPVKAMGSRYAAVPYRTRRPNGAEEIVPYRIMGMVAGTKLTYDPPVPQGAPDSLDVGQVIEFSSIAPFVVTSQDADHPFYLAGHMTGNTSVPGNTTAMGDPETVNILPPEQFLSSYRFFTDPTYSETNLVLVRGPAAGGAYADVLLDCLGTTPVPGWTAIGNSGLEFTRVDLQTMHAPVGACDNGLHTIKSDSPFGLTVWGWDFTVSYAYPAGASVNPINTVAVPPVVH